MGENLLTVDDPPFLNTKKKERKEPPQTKHTHKKKERRRRTSLYQFLHEMPGWFPSFSHEKKRKDKIQIELE